MSHLRAPLSPISPIDFANLSEIVRDCQRLSEIVRDCQRLSEIVRDCQRLSEIVRDCQILSESVRSSFLVSPNVSNYIANEFSPLNYRYVFCPKSISHQGPRGIPLSLFYSATHMM
jgi:hypothetical protein